jgi:hypothetical protein
MQRPSSDVTSQHGNSGSDEISSEMNVSREKPPHHFGVLGDPDDQYREVAIWEVIAIAPG